MSNASNPQIKNRILNALPLDEYESLASHLQLVELTSSQRIYSFDQLIDYIYFPNNCMISVISTLAEGTSIEVGIIGSEGLTGISTVLGVNKPIYDCMVQIPGSAMRLDSQTLRNEFKRGGILFDLILRYMHSLLIQSMQVAACNRTHSISERLARWLLMSYDRCQLEELPLTQEFLSYMLGCRRAGVTEAAIILQAENYIRYTRGHITIIDIEGLKDFACECYQIIKNEFDLLK